jgi:uncharacterized protein YqeY
MLRQELGEALKTAMRGGDKRAVSTVRLILAALKDRDIAVRSEGRNDGISEDEILGMLQKMVKQREESMRLYEEGGRAELAQQEAEEIEVIQRFLPRQLSESEIDGAVGKVMSDMGATSIKDMGRVMTQLRETYAGRMDFAKASAVVKTRLTGQA